MEPVVGRFYTGSLRSTGEADGGAPRARSRSGALSGSTIRLDEAADDWWGPWPPPALVDASGTIPAEERRGS